MIVPLAEHVSMNVPLRQYQKVKSIRSILISAQTVEHALMSARPKQFIPNNYNQKNIKKAVPMVQPSLFYEFYLIKFYIS